MRKVVAWELVSLLTHLFGEVLDGRNAHLANEVRRAPGRGLGTSATTRGTPLLRVSGTELARNSGSLK